MQFRRTVFVEAPPEEVWRILSDTDRMNQEAGLPAVEYAFLPRQAGGSDMFGVTALGSLRFRYREQPYEWIRPHFYTVLRTFEQGPVTEFLTEVRLFPEKHGTRLLCCATLLPRSPLLAPVIRIAANKLMNDMARAWRGFADYLEGRLKTPYPRSSAACPVRKDRLERSIGALGERAPSQELAQNLARFLAEATPEEVALFRPFRLADRWGADRMEVLRLCLLAARREVGLLDLRWRLLCPNCRGSVPQNTAQRLGDIDAQAHCPSCNIRYDANFDDSVEVCFRVTPSVRPAQERIYCRGGPYMTPHVAAQWVLEPKSQRTDALRLPAGKYVLASLQAQESHTLEVRESDETPKQASIRLVSSMGRVRIEVSQTILPAESVWSLDNQSEETVVLRLEAQESRNEIASAALVTSLQAFRDQFSAEVLKPGIELAVQQVCILFTDLKGSTAMYRNQGDAPSYRAVRDHFDFLRRIIDQNNGAIVKTIGDAVMAAFRDPAQGLSAALHIQKEAQTQPDGLCIKAGLHCGPAIVVNANDLLDYFGHTVNLAARLQKESEGADIVLSLEMAQDPETQALLASCGFPIETLHKEVRGIEEALSMVRVRVFQTEANSETRPSFGAS